jgi:hypothetical protein
VTIGLFYVVLLALGLLYAVVSGALGWLSDLGDADVQIDAGGHFEAAHPHPISGTTLATFVTGFGAGGVLGHYALDWALVGSLGLAVGCGLVAAAAAFGMLELIFRQTQAGSEFAVGELAGREAEVITSIPAGGAGEVAYLVRGQREQGAARSADGSAIAKGRLVTIERVAGSTVYVRDKG